MSWKEKVQELMRQNGWSQKKLAEMSGVTESSVSRYLGGERSPRMDIIVNFARALNVTVEYLLDEDTECNLDPYTEIATAIARSGNDLTAEEKTKLIALILGQRGD